MRFWYVLCWCASGFIGLFAQSPPSYVFKGVLLQRIDSIPIAYAHVYTGSERSFSVSDAQGHFRLSYRVGDTLRVSSIQHETRWIVMETPRGPLSQIDTVWMEERVYVWRSVSVYADNFTKAFSGFKRINYDYQRSNREDVLNRGVRLAPISTSNVIGIGVGLEGALTSLLLPLTSEYQQLKQIQELEKKKKQERYHQRLVDEKLSEAFVRAHSHILPSEREGFITFWNPTTFYLELASEYRLIADMEEAVGRYITYLLRVNSHRVFSHRMTTLELRQWLGGKKDFSTQKSDE